MKTLADADQPLPGDVSSTSHLRVSAPLVAGDTRDGQTVVAVALGDVNGLFSEEAHPNTASADERVVFWVDFGGGGSSFYLASASIFSDGFHPQVAQASVFAAAWKRWNSVAHTCCEGAPC